MKTLTVSCTVKDGKLKLFERFTFDQGLRAFGDGEELTLTIEPVERRRTQQQNRYFHGPILSAFMEHCGYTKDEAKTELCLLHLPREHTRPDGSVVIVPGHTSALTVDAFNDFIDACIRTAAEMDIVIPDAAQWRAA